MNRGFQMLTRKRMLLLGLLGTLAVAGTYGRTTLLAGRTDGSRAPASVNKMAGDPAINASPGKLERLRGPADAIRGLTGKARGVFSVELTAEPATAVEEGQTLRLIARVRSRVPTSRVDVVWTMPPEVELTQGRLEDALVGMEAGEEREIEITVTTHTKENRIISLRASQMAGDTNLVSAATYNTVDEQRIKADLVKNAEISRLRYGDDVMNRLHE